MAVIRHAIMVRPYGFISSVNHCINKRIGLAFLLFLLFPSRSYSYESVHTGKVASAALIFYYDQGIIYGMVVCREKEGKFVSIINAWATIATVYYCKEISSFTNRPDTGAYREEKDMRIQSDHFQEFAFSNGETVFGLPVFRYDGTPWFRYDMNWYKLFPELFYDKERICTKASVHFFCRGIEAEGTVDLLDKAKKIRNRITEETGAGK